MKQAPTPLTRAALLLAAAALPLTPALAQDTTAPAAAEPPAAQAPAPDPAATTPAPLPETVDTTVTTPPAATTPTPEATTTTTTTRTTRTTARAPVRVPARVVTVAPAPVAVAPVPIETLPTTEVAPLPPPVAQTPPPEVLPETTTAPVPVATTEDNRASFLPWLLGGLLLVGALALFALGRRRRTVVYDEVREPIAEPVVAAAPIVPERIGLPELELAMRPLRAGVSERDARVEFELTVDNRGDAPAEDVRISTWMLASGATEMERALIEPRDHADTPPVTIPAGEARTLEAAVALPTAEVEGDAVLPVVVADARYRLPDGSERHTRATFAVGVPDGEELAHFDTENPSGLHEGVVARALGEPEQV
jgi:hypothetical protein